MDGKTLVESAKNGRFVPIQVVERQNANTWQEVWKEEELKPAKLGEPCVGLIIVKGRGASELVLWCHHFLADGGGLLTITRQLLLCLENESLQPSYKEADTQNIMQFCRGVFSGCVKRCYGYMLALKQLKEFLIPTDLLPRRGTPLPELARTLHVFETVDAATVKSLKTLYKQKEFGSMTGVLNYAVLKATAQLIRTTGSCKVCSCNVVDLRRLPLKKFGADVGSVDELAFMTSAHFPRFTFDSESQTPGEMWEEADQVLFRTKNNDFSGAIALPFVTRYSMKMLPTSRPPPHSILFSNLGVLPLKTSYAGVGNIRFVRTLINWSSETVPWVTFSTLGDSIDFALVGSNQYYDETTLHKLAARIKLILTELTLQ